MAIQYKSIYDMPKATYIGPNDRFLVATGTKDNFTTAAILYNQLSGDIYKVLDTVTFDIKIINDRNALNDNNPKSVAHAQVINDINNDLSNVMSNYISKTIDFNCTTQWTFSKAPTITDQYTEDTPENTVATLDWVRKSISNLAKTYPIYTNLWTEQDTKGRILILSDILPKQFVPSNITIYVLFQNRTNATYTPKFTCTFNGVTQPVQLYDGTEKIDWSANNNLKSWAHYRVKLSGLTENLVKTVLLNINTTSPNVMCSLVIYGTHTYAY